MPPDHDHLLTRRTLLGAALATGAGLGLASNSGPLTRPAAATPRPQNPVKTRATYYRPERVEAMRTNVAEFAWARELRDTAVADADAMLTLDLDRLWSEITTQGLPRSYAVNQELGSPITGQDIYEWGNYPWVADPIATPWQLTDPSSDYVFPTNDFAAFYASALDEHGNFDPKLGDPQYLVNTRYPDRGETWGVDDGLGWVDDDGNRWTFIAYYNHWFCWYGPTATYSGFISALADAYAYTGNTDYARHGLIALDRIADVYPEMDATAWKRSDGYLHSDGLTGMGKAIGCIWETGLVKRLCSAYDALWPAIADTDEAGVLDFLSDKASEYGLPAKDTPAKVRANIENGILREIYPAVQNARIRGNFGMHQSALALAAVVQDDEQASREWLEFVFQPGEFLSDPYRVTGGDVFRVLLADVDRDGQGNEASPTYNDLWLNQMKSMADVLEGYDLFPAADLYQHPTVARMFTHQDRFAMLGEYTPPIGDTGSTGKPELIGSSASHTQSFAQYRRAEDAQLAHQLNGGTADGLNHGIFTEQSEQLQNDIRAAVRRHGPLALPATHFSGYGLAALRDGDKATGRGVQLYYGRNTGHGHFGTLNLGLWAHGVDLLPDLGYPEFADDSIRRHEWVNNTVSHNAVVVDRASQQELYSGTPLHFATDPNVQFVDVEAAGVYPQLQSYRRAVAMIKIDADNSYVVDVFRVIGGNRHDYSFHAAEGRVTTEGLSLTPQPTGTYAGPEVPQPPDDAPPNKGSSGFRWLTNVSTDTDPGSTFTVDYSVVDTWDVHDRDPDLHLRATFFGQFDEVALCDGEPPRNKPGNPEKLRYLMGRRQGKNLRTLISAVLEPYVGSQLIKEVRPARIRTEADVAPDEVAAIRVELINGRVDYIVHSVRPDVEIDVEGVCQFTGTFGVLALRDGAGVWAVLMDGHQLNPMQHAPGAVAQLQLDPPAFSGTVASFTSDLDRDQPAPDSRSEIMITPAGDTDPDALAREAPGLELHVAGAGERVAVYPIADATVEGSSVRLDLGSTTLVRGYVDDADTSKGYSYDVAVGRSVRIPRQRSWSA